MVTSFRARDAETAPEMKASKDADASGDESPNSDDALKNPKGTPPARVSPLREVESAGEGQRGRGIAFACYENEFAYVAAVAEVEVSDRDGIRVRRVTVAHDCGQIVNPNGLENQIEGNVLQAIGRTLKEEVRFDPMGVTSLEWGAYPLLTFVEIPAVDIVLVDRLDEPPVGAGEATSAVIPAAIANAVFDATGRRLRTVPLRWRAES